MLWTVLDIKKGRRSFTSNGTAEGIWARVLLVLLLIQIVWGAFTAGLDAGHMYNTWPLMNGEVMPENVTAYGSLLKDFTDHRDGVQFIHRYFAWVVAFAFVWYGVRFSGATNLTGPSRWLMLAVGVQFVLGILTVLSHVHIALGVAHQFGALLLLACGVCWYAHHRKGDLFQRS